MRRCARTQSNANIAFPPLFRMPADLSKLTIEDLSDLLGPLDAAEKLHQATVARPRKAITDEIQLRYQNQDATGTFTPPSGKLYALIIGAKKLERTVTNRDKLRKALGALFADLWEIGVGKIDKHTTEKQRASFMSEACTGARAITVITKG